MTHRALSLTLSIFLVCLGLQKNRPAVNHTPVFKIIKHQFIFGFAILASLSTY